MDFIHKDRDHTPAKILGTLVDIVEISNVLHLPDAAAGCMGIVRACTDVAAVLARVAPDMMVELMQWDTLLYCRWWWWLHGVCVVVVGLVACWWLHSV